MSDNKEFWLHRGLFWELVSASILGGKGIAASWRSASEQKERAVPRASNTSYGIVIFPGVFAPKLPYYFLEETLRNKLAVDVLLADMGIINAHSHVRMMKLARESFLHTRELDGFYEAVLIGHSMGGLITLMLLGQYPERIKKIFCITSPVNIGAQTPWKALQRAIALLVARPAFQRRVLESIIHKATPHAEKVVTISTASDIILPLAATRFPFPGAKNYVYDAHHKGRFQDCSSALLDTHAGLYMHPFTLDVILHTLREEK